MFKAKKGRVEGLCLALAQAHSMGLTYYAEGSFSIANVLPNTEDGGLLPQAVFCRLTGLRESPPLSVGEWVKASRSTEDRNVRTRGTLVLLE